ncbi:LOW QUALITY PROTEIN: lysosomal alpha-mannosidase-like [Saccoglossus kowalevskii]
MILNISLAILLIQLQEVVCQCGYKACEKTKDNPVLNIHLVPHTHDDVGWLKTVDQYYYGANNSIQHAGIQYILDSVVGLLQGSSHRKFVYVEMAFFMRWWRQQNEEMRNIIKDLVNKGQLQFAGGGWSQNDEAATHYTAIIDNMAYGMKFLKDTFGDCSRPLVAWQIDVFGHSKEQAALFAMMGFDGVFFARIDAADRLLRKADKRLEGMWHASQSLSSAADLFYGAFYDHYSPPDGFCFDIFCDDQPIQDDQDLLDYNVDERVDTFVKLMKEEAKSFQTNHIMLTMGNDFNYENANEWFKNMDKLLKYVNMKENETNVHVLYSSPACYLYALNQADVTWSSKTDDFFPYGSPFNYWTGFYTSRPALKGYIRIANKVLQTCKQIKAVSGVGADPVALKDAIGIVQHHDAVTGTEKQHVANDYAKRLAIGIDEGQKIENDGIAQLIKINASQPSLQFEFCNNLNISICHVTETLKMFTVTAYNPLAYQVLKYIRLPVNGMHYSIKDPDDNTVKYQVVEVTKATQHVRKQRGNASHELIFPVNIPAVGFSTYTVTMDTVKNKYRNLQTRAVHAGIDDTTISNNHLSLTFDGKTGLLKSIKNMDDDIMLPVRQMFYWYSSSTGDIISDSSSSPYIFRPNGTKPFPVFDTTVNLKVFKSNLFEEVQQEFGPGLSQVIRLYKGQQHAEFEYTVGPIPFKDGLGKEIISRFDTSLKNDGIFYTDSNGRQIMKRRRNHRDTFPYINTDPVAGNYYPINTKIFIKDNNTQLTVVTDRSHGGSSIQDGSLEIMVHRRLLYYDGGEVEALNETGQFGDGLIIRGDLLVTLNPMQIKTFQVQIKRK